MTIGNLKSTLSVLSTIAILTLIFSCRNDLEFDRASQTVRLSTDTLFFDTIFNQIRSETYAIKIYNNEDKDVVIPRVYLAEGNNSNFYMNVDGVSGNDFVDVPLRAKDSMYVFLETVPQLDPPQTALIEEDLVIETTQNQIVKLFTLVEDAEFFYPGDDDSYTISSNTTWNNSQSKVIFKDLKITNGASLTIEPGTKVYFHKNSSLTVDESSHLQVNGSLGNEVLFRGDRHETRYDTLPANWDKIHVVSDATATINYAIIKGGIVGIQAEKDAVVQVSNTKLFNHVSAGILGIGANIIGSNLVINHCGESSLLIVYGGSYNFKQCTFANFWNLSVAPAYSVYISNQNVDDDGNTITNDLTSCYFGNCIMWSSSLSSIGFDENEDASFNYLFDTNAFKLSNQNTYDPSTDPNQIFYKLNFNPYFYNTLMSRNLLYLTSDTPNEITQQGSVGVANTVPLDINGMSRIGVQPSLGAYQYP